MNVILISGYISYLKKQESFTSFSLANQVYNYKKKEKVYQYFNCSVAGKTKETVDKYCNDGDQIIVMGVMNINKHEDKTYYNINVDKIYFLKKSEKSEKKKDISNPWGEE